MLKMPPFLHGPKFSNIYMLQFIPTTPNYVLVHVPGDAFPHHNGMKFTTPDQDNDLSNVNCAVQYSRVGAGWWFGNCDNVCFTFSYANNKKGLTGENLMQWVTWKGSEYSLKYADMMIRRS